MSRGPRLRARLVSGICTGVGWRKEISVHSPFSGIGGTHTKTLDGTVLVLRQLVSPVKLNVPRVFLAFSISIRSACLSVVWRCYLAPSSWDGFLFLKMEPEPGWQSGLRWLWKQSGDYSHCCSLPAVASGQAASQLVRFSFHSCSGDSGYAWSHNLAPVEVCS